MSCRNEHDFGTRHHVCECRADTGHTTAHECRCGRSWWNYGQQPATDTATANVDGYAYVEGKGYVPHGKAAVYEAMGKTVDWGTHRHAADKDLRILQYKDDTEGPA